jgi:hypothetical protein
MTRRVRPISVLLAPARAILGCLRSPSTHLCPAIHAGLEGVSACTAARSTNCPRRHTPTTGHALGYEAFTVTRLSGQSSGGILGCDCLLAGSLTSLRSHRPRAHNGARERQPRYCPVHWLAP